MVLFVWPLRGLLRKSKQQGKLRVGPPGAKATGTLAGFQICFHVDPTGDATARGLRPNRGSSGRGLRSPKPREHLPGSKLDCTLTQRETLARGLQATGTLTGFQVRLHVDTAGDTCSRTSTRQGKLRAGPPGAKATGTLTGSQVSFHVDQTGGLRPNGGRSAWSTRSIS